MRYKIEVFVQSDSDQTVNELAIEIGINLNRVMRPLINNRVEDISYYKIDEIRPSVKKMFKVKQ